MKIAYIRYNKPTKEVSFGKTELIVCAFILVMCGFSLTMLKAFILPEAVFAATFA